MSDAPETLDALDVASIDPSDMLGTVVDSPRQWAEALEIAAAGPTPTFGPDARVVLVAGMGGSGISGDVAALVASKSGATPILPVKGYHLPAWTGPDTPLVAMSYSGNTEETLSCVADAQQAGAPLFAVTSGGRIGALCDETDTPSIRVPGGGQPRASLAYLAVPLLVALERAGVLPEVTPSLASVPDHLRALVADWGPDADPATNPAWQMARNIHGTIPCFHGGRGLGGLVALRAKCQINENSKRPAFWHEYPELDHNEIVGWGGVTDGERISNIVLRSSDDEHQQVKRRISATLDLTREVFTGVGTVELPGDDLLQRLAAGVLFVDLVSVYLGLIREDDPTPVTSIEQLKRTISQPA